MKGIRSDAYGFQAFVKVKGRFISKRFPRDTHPSKMQEWRLHARARAILNQPEPTATGPTFDDDTSTYLDAVTSMPSYSDREQHIKEWGQVFAGRDRQTVTALEIRTQLEKWRKTLSASSCNKRRTALMSFYTVLNGKSGYNPVRDVRKYEEDSEPRAQHPVTIYRVLALMPASKTRARLRVILTTGWPHAQVKKLKAGHVDLERRRAYVTPRRKGKGRKGTWLPLLPAAVTALKDFAKWDAWGEFSHSAMHSAFQRAVGKLNARRKAHGHPPLQIRPYDLRHTFGTALAHRITDERALQELMMHSRIEQTRRYTEAATSGRVERAIAELTTLATSASDSTVNNRTRQDKPKAKASRKPLKLVRARQDSNLRPPA